jgi:hypothetical protein
VVEFDQAYPGPLDAKTTETLAANGNVVLYRPVGKLARLFDWMDHPFGGRTGLLKVASGDLPVLTLGAGHLSEAARTPAGLPTRGLPRFMVHANCAALSSSCALDSGAAPLALADVRDHLIAQGQDLSGVTDDLAKTTALRIGLWTLFGLMPIFGVAVFGVLYRERKLRAEFAQIFARTPWRAFPTTYVIRPHTVIRFLPGQFFSFWTTVGTVSKALPVTTIRFNYRPPGGADEDLVGVSVPLGRGKWMATRIFLPNSLIRRIEAEQRRLGIAPPARPESAAGSSEQFDRYAA